MKIRIGILAILPVLLLLPAFAEEETEQDKESVLLAHCGDYLFGKFKITPYLELAQALQALPKETQAKKLMGWAEEPRNEWKLHILCQMLFCAKDGSSVIKPSGLGGSSVFEKFPSKPHFYGPAVIYQNCPILICSGYRLAGMPVPSSVYLATAIKENLWRDVSYEPLSEEKQRAIIDSFLKLEQWSELLQVYLDPRFFTDQAGRADDGQSPAVAEPKHEVDGNQKPEGEKTRN